MNIFMTIFSLLNSLNLSSSKEEPVRLEKKEPITTFEMVCHKICPYVIIICLLILGVLLFLALAKYGHILSTEANHYERLSQIVTG